MRRPRMRGNRLGTDGALLTIAREATYLGEVRALVGGVACVRSISYQTGWLSGSSAGVMAIVSVVFIVRSGDVRHAV
jgi:hypothetical protein